MDAGSLVPPLVSVITTAVIGAVKDPIGKAFENRTKRVQFWKTMLDAAPLAGVTDVSFYQEQCRQEMAEAVDAVGSISNKFVGEFSTMLLFSIGILVLAVMARLSLEMLNQLRQQGVPAITADWLGLFFAIAQSAVIAIGWFWGRWKLKRWVWDKIKPGAQFEALLRNRSLQGLAGLAGLVGVAGLCLAAWFSTRYILFPR